MRTGYALLDVCPWYVNGMSSMFRIVVGTEGIASPLLDTTGPRAEGEMGCTQPGSGFGLSSG